MNSVTKSRVLALCGAVVLVSIVACADSPTQPPVTGARAPRDTTAFIPGDTTECRAGWHIVGGRYVCD
jgi:hypothetical protein